MVMKSVLSGERPVLQVLHDPDNGWGFADGVDDPNTPGGAVAAHISHVTRLDPTLAEMAKLPPGTLADRLEVGGEWHVRSFAWEEESTMPDFQDNNLEGANGTANFENLSPGVRVVRNALELAMNPSCGPLTYAMVRKSQSSPTVTALREMKSFSPCYSKESRLSS